MDILKLFFDHDLRLDKLEKRNANKTEEEKGSSLEDFMSPDPTYSKFYLSGTKLQEELFGLNTLDKSDEILHQLDNIFAGQRIYTSAGDFKNVPTALNKIKVGHPLVISNKNNDYDFESLKIDEESNVGHKKDELRQMLESGAYVLYKEQAHHGYDLHLFSMENIYSRLFVNLKPLVDDQLRFFSINSKRMGSERHFYFETWTLDKPPHGAEEVFPETVL